MAKKFNTQLAGIIVGGIVLLAGLWGSWDLWNRRARRLDCGDGQSYRINERQFATQYSAYSLQLEPASMIRRGYR